MKLADAVKQFWSVRSDKERIMLCAIGAAALVAAACFILLVPALAASKQLSVALPGLRAQVEDMRQQQKEIAILRKKIGAASQHPDLKVLLQSSAARTSFASSIEKIESLSRGRTILLAASVNFDDWLGWMEGLQREFGVRLDNCKITATDRPGQVRVEATFVSTSEPSARSTR